MKGTRQSRRLLLAVLLLCASAALAQHGGGPGGGGPPGGGGMGGPGGGFGGPPPPRMGENVPRGENFVPQRPAGPQLGLPGRWWDDKKTVKTLDLRNEQKSRMDEIFNSNKGTLLNQLNNLQREEMRLQQMSPQELQDQGRVDAQIDRVAAARAELEKTQAHILMQIRQQLDPNQLKKLDSQIADLR